MKLPKFGTIEHAVYNVIKESSNGVSFGLIKKIWSQFSADRNASRYPLDSGVSMTVGNFLRKYRHLIVKHGPPGSRARYFARSALSQQTPHEDVVAPSKLSHDAYSFPSSLVGFPKNLDESGALLIFDEAKKIGSVDALSPWASEKTKQLQKSLDESRKNDAIEHQMRSLIAPLGRDECTVLMGLLATHIQDTNFWK